MENIKLVQQRFGSVIKVLSYCRGEMVVVERFSADELASWTVGLQGYVDTS